MNTMQTEMRVRFNMPPFEEAQLPRLMINALIQNCISGIRQGFMLGLVPAPLFKLQGDETPPPVFTADVFSNFEGLNTDEEKQIHTQHLGAEVQKLWQNTMHNPMEVCKLNARAPNAKTHLPPAVAFDQYRWERLMFEFASKRNIPKPHDFTKLSIFNLCGMDAQLFYSESKADEFEIRIDIGTVPKNVPALLMYQTLLTHNAVAGHETDLWWAMNPNNMHLVMVLKQGISSHPHTFTPMMDSELAELLEGLVKQATNMWADMQQRLRHVENIKLEDVQAG